MSRDWTWPFGATGGEQPPHLAGHTEVEAVTNLHPGVSSTSRTPYSCQVPSVTVLMNDSFSSLSKFQF